MGIFDAFRKKKEEPKPSPIVPESPSEAPKPAPRVWESMKARVSVDDQAMEELLRHLDLDENDDYSMKKADLIEEHEGEKVYRFMPRDLSFRVDGIDVYVTDDEEVERKIGTVTAAKAKDIAKSIEEFRKPWCTLYGGDYKRVYDDDVMKSDDPHYVVIEYQKFKKTK